MKWLLIISSFLMLGCASQKNGNTKYLTLKEAYQKTFVKGKQDPNGKTSGTSYSIVFSKYEEVTFEKLWISKRIIEFEATEDTKNDLMYLTAIRYSSITVDGAKNADPVPFDYEGKALIQYEYKGKTKYFVVPEFEVREPLNGQ